MCTFLTTMAKMEESQSQKNNGSQKGTWPPDGIDCLTRFSIITSSTVCPHVVGWRFEDLFYSILINLDVSYVQTPSILAKKPREMALRPIFILVMLPF